MLRTPHPRPSHTESPYAWLRLAAALLVMTIGGVVMYAPSVVLPAVQRDFGVVRAMASVPYTVTLIGFGLGGILMGRLADRFGVMWVVLGGAVGIGLGLVGAGLAPGLWTFALVQGLLAGLLGMSATMAPIMADTSRWFSRNRGIAMGICMSGNYMAGSVWPPVIQHFVETVGWRQAYIGIGVFCCLSLALLSQMFRRAPPADQGPGDADAPPLRSARFLGVSDPRSPLGQTPGRLQFLLALAGLGCCVAMAMPQVHIVAYCTDLGFGAARGAEMLSLMMGLGIVSRLASGWVSDRVGGLRTLLIGTVMQCVALVLFLPFDGLVPLYVVSGLFGLFQGGLVPSYALIVREYFSPAQAGARMGVVLMATMFGMALGGWMSGAVFDWTGSYRAAFVNGIAWNLLTLAIAGFLLLRVRKSMA